MQCYFFLQSKWVFSDSGYTPQVSKFMRPPNDERNILFTNAEEEVFLPECELVLNLVEDGESGRAFATAFSQVKSRKLPFGEDASVTPLFFC